MKTFKLPFDRLNIPLVKYSGPFESGVFPWCIHAGTLLVGGGVSHLNSGKSGSPCMSTFQHSIATDFGSLGPPWRLIFASSLAMIDIIDSIHRAVSLHFLTSKGTSGSARSASHLDTVVFQAIP